LVSVNGGCKAGSPFPIQSFIGNCFEDAKCYHFDMSDLLIRGVPDEVIEKLSAEADRHRRSREKHALFLLEQGLSGRLENPAELLNEIWASPAPDVTEESIEYFQNERGRRSNRPK
jgi:plasmid stability protein